MNDEIAVKDPGATLVRPRLVWGGTGLAIAGVVDTGIGLMLLAGSSDAPWVIGGGVLATVLGLAVAWRGGVLQDTMARSSQDAQEVLHGGKHEGISSRAELVGGSSQVRATAMARRKRRFLRRSQAAKAPTLRVPGAVGLIVLGTWLCLDQWLLRYPFSISGQNAVLRDVGLGVVLVLTGLRLCRSGGRRWASLLGLAAGMILVASALVLSAGSPLVRGNELSVGLL